MPPCRRRPRSARPAGAGERGGRRGGGRARRSPAARAAAPAAASSCRSRARRVSALLQLVEAMPDERRKAVRARFAAAEAAIDGGRAGRARRAERPRAVGRLFRARRALPVPRGGELLDPSRPAAGLPRVSRDLAGRALRRARAGRRDAGAPCPKVSLAARGLQDEEDDWFPLAMLMAWARTRPRNGERRPGPEWMQRFLKGSAANRTLLRSGRSRFLRRDRVGHSLDEGRDLDRRRRRCSLPVKSGMPLRHVRPAEDELALRLLIVARAPI